MKNILAYALPFALLAASIGAQAASAKRDNYVVFNIKGDCGQEDCIAALKETLHGELGSILWLDAASLAPHQTVDYKTVIITFKDLKTAPYGQVMQGIASLGYNVVSYVIHDTHGGLDSIIPH